MSNKNKRRSKRRLNGAAYSTGAIDVVCIFDTSNGLKFVNWKKSEWYNKSNTIWVLWVRGAGAKVGELAGDINWNCKNKNVIVANKCWLE